MDEDLHDIDDLFRKAINEHRDAPSTGVWEQIDKNLDKKNIVSISKKYQKLKWVAAAMLIFSAGLAIYTWNTRLKNKELVKQNKSTLKKLTETNKSLEKVASNNASNTAITKTDTLITKRGLPLVKKHEKASLSESTMVTNADNKNKKEIAIILPSTNSNISNPLNSAAVFKNKSTKVASTQVLDLVANENTKNIAQKALNKNTGVKERNIESVATDNDKQILKQPIDVGIISTPKTNFFNSRGGNLALEGGLAKLSVTNRIKSGEEISVGSLKNITKKAVSKPTFSASIFYSPNFVSKRVDEDRHNFREDDRNEIKSKEKIANSSTFGFLVSYKTASPITFQSGLTFSTLTTNIQPKTIYARPDDGGNVNYRFNCTAGYSFVSLKTAAAPNSGDSITALNSTNTLKYITVPFLVSYQLAKGKFTINPGLGVGVNLLTKGRIETVIAGTGGNENENIDHIEGLNNNYFTGTVNLAASYSLNNFLSVSFTPTARFALTAINKDTPVKTYLNSFGLAAGFNIRL